MSDDYNSRAALTIVSICSLVPFLFCSQVDFCFVLEGGGGCVAMSRAIEAGLDSRSGK